MNECSDANAIESAFKVVCDFCRNYPTVRGGLPSSDPNSTRASEALVACAEGDAFLCP